MTDSTGIVRTPAFGEDPIIMLMKRPAFVNLVDAQGKMVAETAWPGVFVKDADPLILEDLKQRGLLFAAVPFTHDYPFC